MKPRTFRPRGRPRAFDEAAALEQALRVFWQYGYEGASLVELTRAMGINRPSLYAAFGNKEALFRKALDRYVETAGEFLRESLEQPTARAAVNHLLTHIVTRPGQVRGCLLVQGALACGESSDAIRRELTLRRAAMEHALRRRFERAVKEGDLAGKSDCAALAKFVATVRQGLAVQMAGGARRGDLLAVVRIAMRAWGQ